MPNCSLSEETAGSAGWLGKMEGGWAFACRSCCNCAWMLWLCWSCWCWCCKSLVMLVQLSTNSIRLPIWSIGENKNSETADGRISNVQFSVSGSSCNIPEMVSSFGVGKNLLVSGMETGKTEVLAWAETPSLSPCFFALFLPRCFETPSTHSVGIPFFRHLAQGLSAANMR